MLSSFHFLFLAKKSLRITNANFFAVYPSSYFKLKDGFSLSELNTPIWIEKKNTSGIT